jgi:hypothetical protein
MALRNRIATVAVTLGAVASVLPVAAASANTDPVSAYAAGQVAAQNGISAGLQAAQNGWLVGGQAGLNGWLTGLQAANGGFSAGAHVLGIPVGVNGNISLGLPLGIGIG